MAKVLVGATIDPPDSGQTLSSNTFQTLTGSYRDGGNTETSAQTTCRAAGTLSNLSLLVTTNSTSTAATTITSRKNTAAGGQSITVTHGVTGLKTDASNTDALVATDVYGSEISVAAGGTGSFKATSIIAVFSATTNHAIAWGAGEVKTTPATASSTFFYMPCGGESNFDSTESNCQLQTDVGGTFKNHQFMVTVNGRASTTTLTSRKNTAAGAQSISVTAASTGLKEDTTNTDTLVANDLFNFALANGTGAGTLTVAYTNGLFTNSTNQKNNIFTGFTLGTVTSYARTASATASFMYILGAQVSNDTTEASEKIQHTYTVSNSLYRLNVSANAYTGTATATSRKNGSAGSQTISITAAATGLKTDSTNTDSLGASDDFCFSIVGGTANTITLRWLSSQDNAAAVTGKFNLLMFF